MLYFVRHGETDFNLFGISQGQLDTSLNKTGLSQAKDIAEKLKDVKFDIIISSTLTRAKQTAELINVYHNLNILFDNRIVEVSKGNLQGQKNPHSVYVEFFKNPHKFDGESEQDVVNRVNSFLKDLKKFKGQNVLVVGHGGILKYLNFCLENKNLNKDKLEIVDMTNCEIKQFEF